MGIFIRLIDKDMFVSPILRIHSDEEEFLKEIELWKKGLLEWVKEDPNRDGMTLGRLEAGTCMVDLLRHLAEYYVKTTPNCGGKVWASLKLIDQPKDKSRRMDMEEEDNVDIIEIKTYE